MSNTHTYRNLTLSLLAGLVTFAAAAYTDDLPVNAESFADLTVEQQYIINFPTIVAYQHRPYTYLKEANGDGVMLVTDYDVPDYTTGDIIDSGWLALFTTGDGVPTLSSVKRIDTPIDDDIFLPEILPYLAASDINKVVKIENVMMRNSDLDAFTVSMGDIKINLSNRFDLLPVADGEYDIIGAVGMVEGAPVLYPIEYRANNYTTVNRPTVDPTKSAVYNLNGMPADIGAGGVVVVMVDGHAVKMLNR